MPFTDKEKKSFNHLIKSLKIKSHTGWKNFTRNVVHPQALVLDIQNTASLQAVVKEIYSYNLQKEAKDRIILRAAGGGRKGDSDSESYSFSECASGEVILHLVGDEFRTINVSSLSHIASIGASVKVGEADANLYKKGFALSTSSLIPYVTVAGLAANAGHGTGKDQPSFAGLMEAMTLCLPNGKIVRIKNPDSDLPKTDHDYPVTREEFAVMRGANLGLFGIVLNLEMKVVPATKLHCVADVKTLPEVLEEIKQGLFEKYPYVNIMYVPTFQKDELTSTDIINVVVYRFEQLDPATKDKNYHPIYSHWKQKSLIKLQEAMKLSKLLEAFPEITPAYMRYLVSRAAIGNKDSESVGPWPMIHYQTAFPHNIADADYIFQVSPDYHEIVDAFAGLINTLKEHAKDGEYPIDYAVYARVFAGTNGGLSTSVHETGKKVCGFDIVNSQNLKGHETFRQRMKNFFLEQLHAKVHWGKYVPQEVDFEKMYKDDYVTFNNTLKNWYLQHDMNIENSMLVNRFAANLLHLPQPVIAPQKEYTTQRFLCKPFCKKKHIDEVLAHIQGDDILAIQLRNEINTLAKKQSRLSNLKDSLFFRKPHSKNTQRNLPGLPMLKP